jgi:hypothetical protein
VLRRIASAAVVGAALLAAFGCGSSGNDASVDSGTSRERIVSPAADPDAPNASSSASSTVSANGLRTVTYRGVQFDVPADWPVHDLAADPSTCVRFDVHAVYLGTPGADMDCPAQIIGRADTVLVEPTAGSNSNAAAASSSDVSAATASGLEVQIATDSTDASTSEVAADVPSAGVSITLTYGDTDATAQQILQSFRAAS